MYKIFNFAIIIFSIVLLFFSFVTFIIIQIDLFNYKFDFSPKGLNVYLKSFSEYTGLFAATITLIVAYFGIKRLEAAETANKDKVKHDRYNDWKIVTDIRIDEIEENNKRFRRELYKVRYNLYSDLYKKNLSIQNFKELEILFNKYLKDKVNFFEEMTKKSMEIGNVYSNKEYTFFFDNLYYVFIGSLNNAYSKIYDDFKRLYINSLNKERIIDEKLFERAYSNYTGVI